MTRIPLNHHEPRCVFDVRAQLGEGPLWMAEEAALYFVDILGHRLHRFHPGTGTHRCWDTPDRTGFLLPVDDGTFLAGLPDGLHRFNPKTGIFAHACAIEPEHPGNRLNDGCVDQQGRIWFGTMDDGEEKENGSIYCVVHTGAELEVSHWDSGYVVSNGPALSPCGKVLYCCDSPNQRIFAFDVSSDGELTGKRVFATLTKGYPDGVVVDSDGNLWCGTWAGGQVTRFRSNGTELAPVSMPVSNVTKVAFGGADLRTVYVTTARKGLTAEALVREPQAGSVFAFTTDVAGQQQHSFRMR